MKTIAWLTLLALAVLWPSRLAGPLDGVPLDRPAEVVVFALFALAIAANHEVLANRSLRVLVVILLSWKAITAAALTQDGLCLRFESPVPVYRDNVTVPHSWDVRADWRSAVPRCSAVMTRDYRELEFFPAWFFNLPPADPGRPATPEDRPPHARVRMVLDGYLAASAPGRFHVRAGEDVHLRARLGDRAVTASELSAGIDVPAGSHHLALDADLVRSHWSLSLRWNEANLWSRGLLTLAPPAAVDRWVRPWGNAVPALMIVLLLAIAVAQLFQRIGLSWSLVILAASLVMLVAGWTRQDALARVAPVALMITLMARRAPSYLQSLRGALVLLGVPWLALWLPRAAAEAGLFTWYSSGDDWWMFQRFAYRIYMQGYWLEGGEPAFWFQPLYRWIAGALHLVFGDSSVGELLWDAAAAGIGAAFAFHVVRELAGFRYAVVAGVSVLATFTLGPAWHLFGRGLSEFSSVGLLYAAVLLAMHARAGHPRAAIAAGLAAALAMFARLNNLPVAVAVVAFALPFDVRAGDIWHRSRWLAPAFRPVVAGVLGTIAIALWLFTARTYYYTGVPSMLFGTSAGLHSVWTGPGGLAALPERLLSSLLVLLTMNDPARVDPRALLLVIGFGAAVLGLIRVRPLSRLPLNLTLLCVAGVVGGFVARAPAYPGRFSLHLIPICTAISVLVIADAVAVLRHQRRPLASEQDGAAGGENHTSYGELQARPDAVG